MNEHEIQRLAAALNQARPDWPLRSLRSFITAKLATRPYRDTFVALAWVACEPNTHTPARVLESGPWWRAAAVEASTAPRHATREESCGYCAQVLTDSCCDHPTPRRIPGVRRPDDFQEQQ